MDQDATEGNCKQLRGKVKRQRGKSTDDDDYVGDRKRHEPAVRRQKRFGVTRYEAEKQVQDWESRF